jgi:hypothetical protein
MARTYFKLPQSPKTTTDEQFKEAVERVYERYGSDLSAFYRDVKKEIQIKRGA